MRTEKLFFIALDGMTGEAAVEHAKRIMDSHHAETIAGWKIHDLYDRYGGSIIESLIKVSGKAIWVDMKLHDTPKTNERRARALLENGVTIVSAYASADLDPLRAVVETKIITYAVSILTSMQETECELECGIGPGAATIGRARWAKLAGAQGLVCSPQEVVEVSDLPELKGMSFICPATTLTPKAELTENQWRRGTPEEAVSWGANYLVLGGQLFEGKDPIGALSEFQGRCRSIRRATAA